MNCKLRLSTLHNAEPAAVRKGRCVGQQRPVELVTLSKRSFPIRLCNSLSQATSGVTHALCPQRSGHFQADARAARRPSRTIARTSADWWEDEEEFDALTEMVLPKELHLVVVEQGAAAGAGADAAADVRRQLSCVPKFTTGFAASQAKAAADQLWDDLGQGGPPYFKKIRTRASLDTLADPSAPSPAASSAAEELLQELCCQTWRVELDYGLQGAEAQPVDRLLLACSGLAARRLLEHAGLAAGGSAGVLSYIRIDVRGYNQSGEASQPLKSWRQLHPQLHGVMA